MAKMTMKQKLFCDEYLVDLNATQAAIRAGYSEKYAHTNAAKLLQITTIKEYIEKRMAEKQSELIAKQDEVLQYLTRVMRREEKESVVITLTTKTEKWVTDKDTGKLKKQTITEESPEVVEIPAKLSDANRAAEMLGRYRGMWANKADLDIEEQRARIDKIKAETGRITGEDSDPREDKIMKLFDAIGGALDGS